MDFNRPKKLETSVEIKEYNRPIKVAYLIPYDESNTNHHILDAIFLESYTRWSGVKTLLVPTNSKEFLLDEYYDWVQFYDPDFIYSYINLKKDLIDKISQICTPIEFRTHENKKGKEKDRWQDFTPSWQLSFNAVPSLSTIHTPNTSFSPLQRKLNEGQLTIITQQREISEERFLADNFGISFHSSGITYEIEGLFNTYCLGPEKLPDHQHFGTEVTTSVNDAFSKIANKEATTISRFALAHSKAIPKCRPNKWDNHFNLFIGDTILDRLHFWNSRHFSPDHIGIPGSLIVSREKTKSEKFLKHLGLFLNNYNFIGYGSSSRSVSLKTYSLEKEALHEIQTKLGKLTFNSVMLGEDYNQAATPETKDINNSYNERLDNLTSFKVSENKNKIQAKNPAHFTFCPARFSNLNEGQWIIELRVERHHNLSRFSNGIDSWMLPRRNRTIKAFTNNLGRVTHNHQIAILPSRNDFPFGGDSIIKDSWYELFLPEDDDFFRWLLLPHTSEYPKTDLRSLIEKNSYKDMCVSDKGQNFRGLISMFDDISDVYECLTNKFWREIFRSLNNESVERRSFTLDQFKGFLPNDGPSKTQLKKRLNLNNVGEVKKYFESNLADTLEFLLSKNVFFRVYRWRCSYCGHSNTRTFDNMKNRSNCEVCEKVHFAPIDLDWEYTLNNFVYRALVSHSGLPVLWALGYLRERYGDKSFYYIPEVDLFYESDNYDKKNEVDLLCVANGTLIAVEAKLSAYSFVNKKNEIRNFIKEINWLRPDIGLLIFEKYGDLDEDKSKIKEKLEKTIQEISKKVEGHTKIEVIIASNNTDFKEFPLDLGYFGRRVSNFYHKL